MSAKPQLHHWQNAVAAGQNLPKMISRKIQEVPDVLNPGIEHAVLESVIDNVVAVKVEFNFALLPGLKHRELLEFSFFFV